MSEKAIAVFQSIAAIQGELAKIGIAKGRKNSQQGFAYRGIDDVYAALAPLLAEHKLCILPRVVSKEAAERTSAKGGVLFYTALTVEFDIVSAIDGSHHTVSAMGEAFDSGDKSIGKAQSYAYKAMAFMLFAIPVEGQDNDPDANSHEVKPALITESQVMDLISLVKEVGANEEQFLIYFKINDMAWLPAEKFKRAVNMLEAKRGK